MGRQRDSTHFHDYTARTMYRKTADLREYLDDLGLDTLETYLKQMPPDQLAKYLSDDQRRFIIQQWADKVQEFWSVRRCALLKSVTLTSNNAWAWNRALLGRTVEDGKWVDKVIDGNFFCFPYAIILDLLFV